jgi:hypothetical protein
MPIRFIYGKSGISGSDVSGGLFGTCHLSKHIFADT